MPFRIFLNVSATIKGIINDGVHFKIRSGNVGLRDSNKGETTWIKACYCIF